MISPSCDLLVIFLGYVTYEFLHSFPEKQVLWPEEEGAKAMDFIESLLAAHPLFQELEPRHLHMLAKGAIEDRFEAQEYLFSEGNKANKWYVIRKGTVALETGTPPVGPITAETLEEGSVLGWSWLVPPYHWQFSARTIESTQVIVLDGTYLRETCESDHDFGYALTKCVIQGVVQRLEALRQRLLYIHPKGL